MLKQRLRQLALAAAVTTAGACHVPLAPETPQAPLVTSKDVPNTSPQPSSIQKVLAHCHKQHQALADCLWEDEAATMQVANALLVTTKSVAKGELPPEWQTSNPQELIEKYKTKYPTHKIEQDSEGNITAIRDKDGASSYLFFDALAPQFLDIAEVEIRKLTESLQYHIAEGNLIEMPTAFMVTKGHIIEFTALGKNGNDLHCMYIDNKLLVLKEGLNWITEKVELRPLYGKVLPYPSTGNEKYTLEVNTQGYPALTEIKDGKSEEPITFFSPIYNQKLSNPGDEHWAGISFEYTLPEGIVLDGYIYDANKHKPERIKYVKFASWEQEIVQTVEFNSFFGGVENIRKNKDGKQDNPFVHMDPRTEQPYYEQNQTSRIYDSNGSSYLADSGRVVCKDNKGQTLRIGVYTQEKGEDTDFTPKQYEERLGQCLTATSIAQWEGFRNLWGHLEHPARQKNINPIHAITDNFRNHTESTAFVGKEILELKGIKSHVVDLSPYFQYVSTRLGDNNTLVWIKKKTDGRFDIYYVNHEAFGKNGLFYDNNNDLKPFYEHKGFTTYKEAIIAAILTRSNKTPQEAEDIYDKVALYWAFTGGIKIPASILLPDGTTKTEWRDVEEIVN